MYRISAGKLCSTHSSTDSILNKIKPQKKKRLKSHSGSLMAFPLPSPKMGRIEGKTYTWLLWERPGQRGSQGRQTKGVWVKKIQVMPELVFSDSLTALVSHLNWTLIKDLPCVSVYAQCLEETDMYVPYSPRYLITKTWCTNGYSHDGDNCVKLFTLRISRKGRWGRINSYWENWLGFGTCHWGRGC